MWICIAWHWGLAFRLGEFVFFLFLGLFEVLGARGSTPQGVLLEMDDIPPAGTPRSFGR